MKSDCRNVTAKTNRGELVFVTLIIVMLFAGSTFGGNFYQGVSPTNVFWPGGTVPYQFDTNITASEQQTYLNGLREWELAAHIHFVQHTVETNWILFKYAPGTFLDQFVPYTVPETVTVSVLSRAQVCHEMGHALGFTHENIRVDKDTYITVLTNNVYPASNIYWFTIDPTSVTNGSYDYESVMHLANNFSSIDPSNLYTQLANSPYQRFQPFMGNLALSAGDRAAAAYLYGPPIVPLTNVVTNTADAGAGSLRAALYYGIDHPGSTIRFNIPTNDPGYSNGVFTIYLTGFIPPLVTDGTIIDGSTQPGFTGKPLIFIGGSQIIPEAYTPGTVTGLYIYAANCQVKNLAFQNFSWNGITIDYPGATNNTIAGCWCGPDYTGTNAAPNAYQGILIYNGASYNIIGGTNALSRNVLSGNSEYGVCIVGTNTAGNIVRGNYIGSDAGGTLSLSDVFGGAIVTGGANSNIIGGAATGAGNLFSGNSYFGLWIDSDNNTVEGNWIGLNASGSAALANDFGMFLLSGAQGNSVISNVISGNYAEGLRLAGTGTAFNLVQGNLIGTDSTGANAVPNGFGGVTFFQEASSNTVGGLTVSARNVISGNYGNGIVISDTNTVANVVEGNFVGLTANGIAALPNDTGVLVANGAQSNVLGGVIASARNIISGNYTSGVFITNSGTTGNIVEGNYIGTTPSGSTALANGYEAVDITGGAQSNTIGGTAAGAGNVLSGNGTRGLWISDPGTATNFIEGNYIGLAADGAAALGNAWEGIIIRNGAEGNFVGASNRIAYNGYEGIAVYDNSSVGNTIRGNSIFSNGKLGIDLVGGTENSYGVTANHPGGVVAGPNDLQNYPVITNAFTSGANTIIDGTLNGTSNRTFWIDCYRNTVADPSGYGEGQVYAGGVAVTTDPSGNAAFSLGTTGNFVGQYFSATATDQTTGDTSEFSQDVIATNGPAPPSFVGPFTLTGLGFGANIALTVSQSYHVQAATNLAANPIAWTNLTNFIATATNYNFLDRTATNSRVRFYRVISP